MAKIVFSKFNFKNQDNKKIIKINEQELEVKTYLPTQEKIDFIDYVLDNAIDKKTQTFSPIRMEVYFNMALVLFYTNIKFSDGQLENLFKTYDLCEQNGLFDEIIAVLTENDDRDNEYLDMMRFVTETAQDISKYSNSFAGILQNMTSDAEKLGTELNDILESVKNKEGIEQLAVIKNIVGQD